MHDILLYIMALCYIAAGINHFVSPRMYMKIMPHWVPLQSLAVKVSGVLEVAFGLLLFPLQSRHIGAWLLIALLLAIFPANVQMAINFRKKHKRYLWLAYARLPLQVVLIWWAWVYTK